MNIKKKLAKILSVEIATKLFVAITNLLIIRFMTYQQYSVYSIGVNTISLVTSVVTSSFNRIFIVGKFDENVGTSSFLSFQTLIVACFAALLLPIRGIYAGTLLFVVLVIVSQTLFAFPRTYFQRQLKFRVYYFADLSRIAIYLLLFFSCIWLYGEKISVEMVLLSQFISFTVCYLIFGAKLVKLAELVSLEKSIHVIKKIVFSEYNYVFCYFVCVAILMHMDVFMLRFLDELYQVAVFSAGFRYYALLRLALGSVHTLLLPLVRTVDTREGLEDILKRCFEVLKIFSSIVVLAIILANWLIPIIDGGKYPESILVFQLLAASSLISFAFSPHANIVMKYSRFKFMFFLEIFGIFTHAILNLVVIPRFHAVGAAVVNLTVYGYVNYRIFKKSHELLECSERPGEAMRESVHA
jgi:O-antigen/teichoic acid export membrane protein